MPSILSHKLEVAPAVAVFACLGLACWSDSGTEPRTAVVATISGPASVELQCVDGAMATYAATGSGPAGSFSGYRWLVEDEVVATNAILEYVWRSTGLHALVLNLVAADRTILASDTLLVTVQAPVNLAGCFEVARIFGKPGQLLDDARPSRTSTYSVWVPPVIGTPENLFWALRLPDGSEAPLGEGLEASVTFEAEGLHQVVATVTVAGRSREKAYPVRVVRGEALAPEGKIGLFRWSINGPYNLHFMDGETGHTTPPWWSSDVLVDVLGACTTTMVFFGLQESDSSVIDRDLYRMRHDGTSLERIVRGEGLA